MTSGRASVAHSRAYALDLLVQHGLEEVARSTRGDSSYLRFPGTAYEIRVSTHCRTAKRRRQYPNVLTSIVIDAAPQSETRIKARVESALRDAAAARSRIELAIPRTGRACKAET